MSSWTYIEDIDEQYAPPERPLLRLSVIGDLLSVAIVTPDKKREFAYDEKAQIIVPLGPAARAVQGGVEDDLSRKSNREKTT